MTRSVRSSDASAPSRKDSTSAVTAPDDLRRGSAREAPQQVRVALLAVEGAVRRARLRHAVRVGDDRIARADRQLVGAHGDLVDHPDHPARRLEGLERPVGPQDVDGIVAGIGEPGARPSRRRSRRERP